MENNGQGRGRGNGNPHQFRGHGNADKEEFSEHGKGDQRVGAGSGRVRGSSDQWMARGYRNDNQRMGPGSVGSGGRAYGRGNSNQSRFPDRNADRRVGFGGGLGRPSGGQVRRLSTAGQTRQPGSQNAQLVIKPPISEVQSMVISRSMPYTTVPESRRKW